MRRARVLLMALLCALPCSAWDMPPARAEEPTGAEIADLIDELRSPEVHVREVARRELVRLGSAPAEALAAAVRGSDWRLRSEALAVLAEIGPAARAVVPRLVEFANSQDAEPLCAVVRVIAQIDRPAARPLVPRLVELVRSDDRAVVVEALAVIACLGSDAEAAVPPLADRLRTASADVQPALVETLLAIGFDAIDHVLDLWTTDHAAVAGWAVTVLRQNPERAVRAARLRLASEDKDVRRSAAAALRAMAESAADAVPDLVRALDDDVGAVRRAAATALAQVGAPAVTAIPALTEALADSRRRIRLESAQALAAIGVAAAHGDALGAKPAGSVERAISDGLAWLARHQAADGHWDCDRYVAQCVGSPCSGCGADAYDVGVTGLALQCFAGAGETPQGGPHRAAVSSGIEFLLRVQDRDGCFGPRTTGHFQYNHLCAALAVTEMCGLARAPRTRESAERAVAFVLASQNPHLAWRYGVRDGDNDTSVTGWAVSVLRAASKSGIDVDRVSFEGALSWVDKLTDAETGRVGYQRRGGPPARTTEMQDRFPPDMSESLTAVGLVVRLLGGRSSRDDPAIRQGAQLLAERAPRWDGDAGTIDLYYWLYGTRAMRLVGGGFWSSWRKALLAALLPQQERGDACARGSWPPADPWAAEGGRIWSTTAALLCLEQCLDARPEVRPPMSTELRAAVGVLTDALKSDDEALRTAAETALDQLRGAYR